MRLVISILFSLMYVSAYAEVSDGMDLKECQDISRACRKADVSADYNGKEIKGFQPGYHKKNGHGMWIDCIGQLSKGEKVNGMEGDWQTQAQECQDARKVQKAEKQEDKEKDGKKDDKKDDKKDKNKNKGPGKVAR